MRYATCDGSFYSGTSGIAWVMGHLGGLTGSAEWIRLAYGCLAHAETHLRTPGLYEGYAGIAATLVELGVLLDDRICVRRGVEVIRRCAAESLERWDLISGISGIIIVLLGISAAVGERALVDDARALAEDLLSRAHMQPEGLSWKGPVPWEEWERQRQDPCGLAHGASGCALALELLGGATGEVRWLEAADAARRYECGGAVANGGWMRFCVETRQPSWCWGTAGIGAERLVASQMRHDSRLANEAGAALWDLALCLRAAVDGRSPPSGGKRGWNLSVCHGAAGAADVLATAAGHFNERSLMDAASGLVCATRECHSQGGMPSGLLGMNAIEVPGFMLGTAGLAYVLARLEKTDVLPSATLPPLLHACIGAHRLDH